MRTSNIANAAARTTRLTRQSFVPVSQVGRSLLSNPSLNKGSAFPEYERKLFDLDCLLPKHVNTLEEQIQRAYQQFRMRPSDLLKNSFMESMKQQNLTLYYGLIQDHIKEMMSIIYTPTQGDAIANYSHLFRRPSGCFLDIHHPEHIESGLSEFGLAQDIDYIVVTDAEGILGIGDQGVGGIGISEAKLALMTACGGVHPTRVIPVVLDVGTNNKKLLEDPLYMGNRHPRIRGKQYDDFVDVFVQNVKTLFPDAVLHFEDFGTSNAQPILDRYLPQLACFNDDIQGTGAVTMAALKGALAANKTDLVDARIMVYGAGSAGVGIANQILDNLRTTTELDEKSAKKNMFLVDRFGLITKDLAEDKTKVNAGQAQFAQDIPHPSGDLKALIDLVKPHVLIGCSTQSGAFTKEVVQTMASHVNRPIILPLSNPTRLHEAVPKDLIEWTNGNVLVATGSPFKPVDGREIAENNNCFIFPGIGLGAVVCRAKKITTRMIAAAVDRLADLAPIHEDPTNGPLLPDISDIREISAHVATAVVLEAKSEGLASIENMESPFEGGNIVIPTEYDECHEWVKSQMWLPYYRRLVPTQRQTRQVY